MIEHFPRNSFFTQKVANTECLLRAKCGCERLTWTNSLHSPPLNMDARIPLGQVAPASRPVSLEGSAVSADPHSKAWGLEPSAAATTVPSAPHSPYLVSPESLNWARRHLGLSGSHPWLYVKVTWRMKVILALFSSLRSRWGQARAVLKAPPLSTRPWPR